MAALRSIHSSSSELTEKIRKEAAYFETHAGRMCYREFRLQHLFVGSGVIEAGCKTVTGQRLKQYAMFRPVDGAIDIIVLRRCHTQRKL